MSLDERYRIRSERTRFVDHLGTEEWTLVYEVPTANIPDERDNFKVSLDNTLPGHDITDVFAPCIHDSVVNIDPDNPDGKIVTCVYRRPTDEMILQPGRGLIEFDSFSTTDQRTVLGLVEKQPVFTGGPAELAVRIPGVERKVVSAQRLDRLFDTVEQTLHEIVERGVIILRLCDWAVNEGPIFERADEWIGKGDEAAGARQRRPKTDRWQSVDEHWLRYF